MTAMNIRDFCVATRLGRTMVQKLINEGQIRSVKIGSRRLIVDTPAEFLQRQVQEASNDKWKSWRLEGRLLPQLLPARDDLPRVTRSRPPVRVRPVVAGGVRALVATPYRHQASLAAHHQLETPLPRAGCGGASSVAR